MSGRSATRHRPAAPTIVHRRDSIDLSVKSALGWDSRFLGLFSGLMSARLLWPSEDAWQGTGLSWCLWVILAALAFAAVRFKRPDFQMRLSLADVAVIVLVVLMIISSRQALDVRPATNMACEWAVIGLAYIIFRQVPRDPAQTSGILWSNMVMVTALACYGLFQTTVEYPAIREAYRANPERTLLSLGIDPGSPSRKAFEDRLLGSNEVMATFALANSLAGILVGPIVLLSGLLFDQLLRPNTRWNSKLARSIPLLLILLLASICLLWTKCRSAYLGLLSGVAVLSLLLLRRTRMQSIISIVVPLFFVIVGLFIAGLATGRMDLLVLTESTKSLQYRVEYWVSTWSIIAQARHWLWGIGPANFSYYYMQFKLPQASEEISDPHNQFLEVWVTAGIFALLAFTAAVLLALWRMTRDEKNEPRRLTDYEILSVGSVQTQVLAYSAMAFIFAPVLGGWNLFQEDLLRRWFVLLVGWAVGWLLCRSILARCQIRAEHIAAALVAITVTWLAAGGVGFPSVSMFFWSLLALGLNLADSGWRSAKTRVVFDIKLMRFVPIAVCVAVLGGFLGAAIPFWKAELARANATDLLNRPAPNFSAARQQILQAISADPRDTSSYLRMADLEYQAWITGGAKPSEFEAAWMKIHSAYVYALTPPRNPLAVTIWRRQASFIDQMIKQHGDRISPQDQIKLLGERAKCLRTASKLYPNLASIWAELAELDAGLGLADQASTDAARAIELSSLMPHADKKLTDETVSRLRKLLKN